MKTVTYGLLMANPPICNQCALSSVGALHYRNLIRYHSYSKKNVFCVSYVTRKHSRKSTQAYSNFIPETSTSLLMLCLVIQRIENE
jgi:hypothetical protein